MGDIADGLVNGDFCEQTGEFIGEGKGYPRTAQKQQNEKTEHKYSGELFGVINYLNNFGRKYGVTNWQEALAKYAESTGMKTTEYEVIAKEIQADFGKFLKYIKNYGS